VQTKRRQYVAFCRIIRQRDGNRGGITELNAKDQELLGLLRLNAREPVSSLARKLNLSRTTVQDRLKRMEENATIAGYTVKLGANVSSKGISALVNLGVEPRRQIDVAKAISKVAEVETLYTVSGKHDLVVMLRAETAEAIDALIDRFSMMPGVTDTETSVILSTKLDRR
jgi:DNA-binding Lrp family transcriptional regulator